MGLAVTRIYVTTLQKEQGMLSISRLRTAKAGLGEVTMPVTSKIIVKILIQKLAMFLQDQKI